jgi:hypothetical protein
VEQYRWEGIYLEPHKTRSPGAERWKRDVTQRQHDWIERQKRSLRDIPAHTLIHSQPWSMNHCLSSKSCLLAIGGPLNKEVDWALTPTGTTSTQGGPPVPGSESFSLAAEPR